MAAQTILLKTMGHHEEGEADGAISPGMAVELAADGKFDQVQATQAEALKGVAGLKIATEDALQGKTVNDAYAATDRFFFYQPIPGDHVQVLIKDGETIAIGDTLVVEGGGSGLFVEAAGTETHYQFEALEAVSPSGSNGLVAARALI